MPPALHSADRNGDYQGKLLSREAVEHTPSPALNSHCPLLVYVHMANIPADRGHESAILHIFMSLRGRGNYVICNSETTSSGDGHVGKGKPLDPRKCSVDLTQSC